MHVHTRADWKARSPKPMTDGNKPTECFIHYTDEPGQHPDHLSQMYEHMRTLQNFHMDGRGWSDIAYHYVVFQPVGNGASAFICQGREHHYVPAAQEGHNTGTLAIAVVAGPADSIGRNTRYAIETLINRFPAVQTVGGHRDVTSTDCPGDKLYSALPRIAQATGRRLYKHH